MKARKTGKDGSVVTVEVDVPADQVAEQADECFMMLASRNRLNASDPRSAKAAFDAKFGPVLGEKMFEDAFMETIASRALALAGVHSVGSPSFFPQGHISRAKDFTFTMTVVERPVVELDSYEPVEVSLVPLAVPDDMVARQLEQLLSMRPEHVTDDSHDDVRPGDELEIDLQVSHNGTVMDRVSSKSRIYQTERNMMPPDFEKQVIGMKVGETKSFDFEVPAAPGIEAGAYQATITVGRITKEVVPELTDEWAKTNFKSCNSVADLEKLVGEEVQKSAEQSYREYRNRVVARELAKRVSGKIPPEATRSARLDYERRFNAEAQQNGLSHDEYLARQGLTSEQFSAAVMLNSLEELKEELAMDAVARHFKLSVNNADIDDYFHMMSPGREEAMRAGFMHAGRMQEVRDAALRMRGCDYMAEHAIVTELDPEQLKKQMEEQANSQGAAQADAQDAASQDA